MPRNLINKQYKQESVRAVDKKELKKIIDSAIIHELMKETKKGLKLTVEGKKIIVKKGVADFV